MLSIFHHPSLNQQGSEEMGRDKGPTGCVYDSCKLISLQAGNILSLSIPAFFYFLTFKTFHLSITAIERKDNLCEISVEMSVVQSSAFSKNIGKNIVILKLTVYC